MENMCITSQAQTDQVARLTFFFSLLSILFLNFSQPTPFRSFYLSLVILQFFVRFCELFKRNFDVSNGKQQRKRERQTERERQEEKTSQYAGKFQLWIVFLVWVDLLFYLLSELVFYSASSFMANFCSSLSLVFLLGFSFFFFLSLSLFLFPQCIIHLLTLLCMTLFFHAFSLVEAHQRCLLIDGNEQKCL